jgi:hypothetical protein
MTNAKFIINNKLIGRPLPVMKQGVKKFTDVLGAGCVSTAN